MIRLNAVSKDFGLFRAVDNVTFTVSEGEVVGFVGPNGAGKSTTINMILGFIRATRGTVHIGDELVLPQTAHKTHKRLGFVAGDMALYDNLTAEQYLDFMGNVHGDSSARDALIKMLDPKMGTKLKALSRGNKQKVALVGALQHRPDVLVMDEPTTGLDPLMQKTFLDLLRHESAKGTTIFMSSHILSEVADVATRVLCMRSGKIVLDSPMERIKQGNYKTVTVRGASEDRALELFGSLPKLAIDAYQDGPNVVFRYNGIAQDLVRWLHNKPIKGITIEAERLDDIIAGLYEDEGVGNA